MQRLAFVWYDERSAGGCVDTSHHQDWRVGMLDRLRESPVATDAWEEFVQRLHQPDVGNLDTKIRQIPV